MLLPHTDASGVLPMLERLRLTLKTTFESAAVPVTASIGAVTFRSGPTEIEEMVHDADACMYSAKNQGGDQVRVTVASSDNIGDQGGPRLPRGGQARRSTSAVTLHNTGAQARLDAAS